MIDDLQSKLQQLTPMQRAVLALKESEATIARLESMHSPLMALVGISCRMPGHCNSATELWQLLINNESAIEQVPATRWNNDKYYDPEPNVPGKMRTKWGGFLHEAGRFDNEFFGMSAREALMTDPQQRMLLELTWEALEDAGIPPSTLRGQNVGVYVGIGGSEYLAKIMVASTDGDVYASTGNASTVAANRISYAFDFRGPSFAIDAACSSVLVAMHEASKAMAAAEIDLAIVAGVNMTLNPYATINASLAGMCSPTGQTRSFDATCDGYVRSEGAAAFVVKRQSLTAEDQNRVYCTIAGTAVNHNGKSNGLSAPNRESQENLMRAACARAKILPASIQYVEAHGTATKIGDALELKAIRNVYARDRSLQDKLVIGSVKTNIGHTEVASGAASLIKVALAMKHGKIPASLHFEQWNDLASETSSQLSVLGINSDWTDSTKVAAVSCLGFGGCNAHAILTHCSAQEKLKNRGDTRQSQDSINTLVLSARSVIALKKLCEKYSEFLSVTDETWANVCTASFRLRDHHRYRIAIVADSAKSAQTVLARAIAGWKIDEPCTLEGFFYGDIRKISNAQLATFDKSEQIAKAYVTGQISEVDKLIPLLKGHIELPTYAWEHRDFWIDATIEPSSTVTNVNTTSTTSANQQADHSIYREAAPEPSKEPADMQHIERNLQKLWSLVLDRDDIDLDDNFFEIGGDSIRAAQLLNHLQAETTSEINIIALFESQTIRKLAVYVRDHHPSIYATLQRAELELPLPSDIKYSSTITQTANAQRSESSFVPITKIPRHGPTKYSISANTDSDPTVDSQRITSQYE